MFTNCDGPCRIKRLVIDDVERDRLQLGIYSVLIMENKKEILPLLFVTLITESQIDGLTCLRPCHRTVAELELCSNFLNGIQVL